MIFDMDGVLIDSVGLNWKAYNQVLKTYGVHVPTDSIYKYMGKTLKDQIQELSDDFSISIDAESFAVETNAIKKLLFANIEPLPGVVKFLDLLKDDNIPMAIGTSNNRTTTIERLSAANITGYFSHIITQDDVTAHKPNPDIYLECAKRLEVVPAQCIVIEDAPVGVEAAHNAGMVCVATASPYTQPSHLQEAELYVETLANLRIQDLTRLLSQ